MWDFNFDMIYCRNQTQKLCEDLFCSVPKIERRVQKWYYWYNYHPWFYQTLMSVERIWSCVRMGNVSMSLDRINVNVIWDSLLLPSTEDVKVKRVWYYWALYVHRKLIRHLSYTCTLVGMTHSLHTFTILSALRSPKDVVLKWCLLPVISS